MALTLRENSHQHIRARDILLARRLNMDDSALDHPLEPRRGLGVVPAINHQRFQLDIEVGDQRRPQLGHVDVAGIQNPGRIFVIQKSQQQVFQSCVLVLTFVGVSHGPMKGVFQVMRKGGQRLSCPF